jgi:hypothetical protein
MIKEDFEKRCWKFIFEFNNEIKFEKGDVWKDDGQGAYLTVMNNHVIITTTDKGFCSDGPKMSVKFNGYCETIDDFDMICKMIRLKI